MTSPSDNPAPERRCPCPTCSRPQPPADAPSPDEAQEPLPLSVNEAFKVFRSIAIRKLEFRAIKALKEHIEATERKLREAEAERDLADKALDEAEQDAARWVKQLNEALATLAGTREALKPFAKEADRYDPDEGDGDHNLWRQSNELRIKHLRAARDVFDALPSPTSEKAEG